MRLVACLRLSFTSVSHETLLSIYSQHYQVSEDYMSFATELSLSFRYLQYGSDEKLGVGGGGGGGGGHGRETDSIFLFCPKMHTKLTHSHHRRAEAMEGYYQQYVQLLPGPSQVFFSHFL